MTSSTASGSSHSTPSNCFAACDHAIEAALRWFDDKSAGQTLPPSQPRKPRGTDLAFDARRHLHRVTGVDLTRIDGIEAHAALEVVAEVGLDMTRWPTEKHFAVRTGKAKAVTATARKLAILVYRTLKDGLVCREPGAEAHEADHRLHVIRRLCQRAASLGFALVNAETGEVVEGTVS